MRLALSGLLLAVIGSSAACAAEPGASNHQEPLAAPPPAPPTGPAGADPSSSSEETSALPTVPCRFLIPRSVEGTKVRCADLEVPEDRRMPGGRTIKIHVAIVKGKPGGVPTVELIGGPGGSAESLVGPVVAGVPDLDGIYGRFLAKGDVVFFDQRGVGRSIPRLSCPQSARGGLGSCARKLGATAKLDAYDTASNADDVHDLKEKLGVPKIDLHGISYGTRLGIEILKRHPNDVRSAILDGVMPSDVAVVAGFEVAMNTVMTKVFTQCAADQKCNAAYPNLDAALTNVKAKLEATPFNVKDPTGEQIRYDWYAFSGELFGATYEEGAAAAMPMFIYDALHMNEAQWQARFDEQHGGPPADGAGKGGSGAETPLIKELNDRLASMTEEDDEVAYGTADGMYLSITCNDYVQHESLDAAKTALAGIRAELRDVEMAEQQFADCKLWPTRASEPNLRAPSTFPGPVLVVGGEFDVATPVEWARMIASSLPNDQLIEVRGGAHGYMDDCAGTIKNAFFTDPSRPIDLACMASRTVTFAYREAPKAGFARRAVTSLSNRPLASILNRVPARTGTERAIARANIAAHIAASAVLKR